MANEILMPKMGMTMKEGTVEEWYVREGDQVKTGDPLFSASTDKITNDVESQEDGMILKIVAQAGETVDVSAVVGYIGKPGEQVPDAPGGETQAAPEADHILSEEKHAEAAPAPAANHTVKASPAAKKLAKEKGIDLTQVAGTGPGGRIKIEDVEMFIEDQNNVKASPAAAKAAADLGVHLADAKAGSGRVMMEDVLKAAAGKPETNDLPPQKVDSLRRSIAKNMTESWHTSPRVTYTHPVDMTAVIDMRMRLKPEMERTGIKISYNHILMKACAQVLIEMPDVNGSFSEDMLTHHKHANIGLAVAKGDGLIVPNVKCCDLKTLSQIADEMGKLVVKTRSGRIDMDDISGGTFTISSLGPYGITNFSPIINQPELAILGVCDIIETPVVRNHEIVILPMMNLCLTADHRVIDGVKASKFLQRLAQILENPYLMMA